MTLNGTVWTPKGPSPIVEGTVESDNGLVSAIAISPSNPNIIYIGTAAGGLWRSSDGGVTWTPLLDHVTAAIQPSLGVGEPGGIAIDPNNTDTIYVGTSSRISQVPIQAGLLKSTDGGASWIQLGSGYPSGNTGNASQFFFQNINVVIVDPANSNILYLASGPIQGFGGGIFISNDGGYNWTPGANTTGGDVRSLVLDSSPTGSRILYAGISGQGVFTSNDGGYNWTRIPSFLPAVSPAIGTGPGRGFGKVVVDIAPPTSPTPNPGGVQVLYVSLEGTGGAPDPVGIFLSKDQGNTWSQQSATNMPTNTQGGYSFHMAVDPASPGDGNTDTIYFGTTSQAKSTDSGNTFTKMIGLHADTHAWAFVRQPSPNPSIVFCGDDGGISTSTNGGLGPAAWNFLNNGGLQIGLFYNIDIKPDATGTVTVGAMQDNGLSTTSGGPSPGWKSPQGESDGYDVAYDSDVTLNRVYGSSGFWSASSGPPIPCTEVFRSDDDGKSYPFTNVITPWVAVGPNTSDTGCFLAPVTTDPSTAGIVYVSGNQNLWQSSNSGAPGSWRILSPFPFFSFTGGNIDVAKVNGNNVVITVRNQVFLSTNALATTVGPPSGVTFTNITRNLPTSQNVIRAVFDPNDPTMIYTVVGGFSGGPGGHVFRTSIGASTWTDISPSLNAPFLAIALDGVDTPSSIYVGTVFGVLRSVDGGSSWYKLDDIHLPQVPVFDLVLRNGELRAGTYGRGVFSFAKPTGPSIAVDPENSLAFGTVCQGPQYLNLKIFNVGVLDLVISSVQQLMGSTSFSVLSTPSTPLVVAPGEDIEFTVEYNPTGPGTTSIAGITDTATIRIITNDPTAPFVDLLATGLLGTPSMVTAIADNGYFGSVCLGSFAEEELTMNNNGACPLLISGIISSSTEFLVPNVVNYPLMVNPGESLDVTVRFQPTPPPFGTKFATFTLFSNDPAGPKTVDVSGVASAPRLSLLISDAGDFGNVCIGSSKDEPLILNNSGECTLSITSLYSSASEFLVPAVSAYPVTIAAGGSLEIPIRFQPSSFGTKSATITVTDNDPAGPKTITVYGNVPTGKLAVTGPTDIGGVQAYCCAERTISICNVGDCKLNVTSVAFKRKSHVWKLINNPFPATLPSGSCLCVSIRYKATEKCPRCMELVITSDDPNTPVKTLDVMAYTVWSDCVCKECCEDCRKGCCEKSHKECCCCEGRQGYPCCDDDEDEDEN